MPSLERSGAMGLGNCSRLDGSGGDSAPGSGRSPGEGNGNLLQYSCLENFMDKGAWQATVHWATKSQDMTE